MLFTPLFRVGDRITMRSDLVRGARAHLLCNEDVFPVSSLVVMSSDQQQSGARGVVTLNMTMGVEQFPQCDFSAPQEYYDYGFIDETTVEAYRIMRYLNYNQD